MRISVCVSLQLLVLSAIGVVPCAGQPTVVVNEFMARNGTCIQDPFGDYDDWIELYNYGDEPVDVAGLYLTDHLENPTLWAFPSGQPSVTTIPSRGYLLIWADDEADEGPLHATFRLAGGGEAVALYDAEAHLIDSVTFGEQHEDVSYGRFPDGGDWWQPLTTPTPGASNDSGGGHVLISEIMYHPFHRPDEAEDTQLEWIELYNNGVGPVHLAGWRLTDGVDFVLPDVVVESERYLVVAADMGAFSAWYPGVTNVVGGWDGRLRNSGETVELRDDAGRVVDAVHYADEGQWAVRELGPEHYNHRGWVWRDDHDAGGKSLELVNPRLPNEYGQNWAAGEPDGGTPGRDNSLRAEDTAPLIVDVAHAPVIPGPGDPVTIRARLVGASSALLTVNLRYRVDRSEYAGVGAYPTYEADSYSALPMFDDGRYADDAAGDGVYGAVVPPHADGTVIEFFIEATDAGGRSRTWPAPSWVDGEAAPVANALYRVDAAFDPDTYWSIGSEPLCYIIMTEMERGRLAYIGTQNYDGYSRSQMNGTFISVDGKGTSLRYNVDVRNRGKGSRRTPPNNYRVNFPHDEPWKGVTAININSKYTYLQVLGNAIFTMAGLPALDAARVQVRVNGRNLALDDPSRMYGSYSRLEVYDRDWAAGHLPGDSQGNLYRCISMGHHCDLRYLGEDPAAYGRENFYVKSTNAATNDWSDLIELTYVLNESSDETYVQDVQEVVDVDEWLRWIALQTLLTNKETNLSNGRGDDYCMYRGIEDPRFILLPYDLDNIVNWSDPTTSIWLDGRVNALPAVGRLLTHPEFAPRYYAQLEDLIHTVLAPEAFGSLVDQVLGGWVPPQRIDAITDFVVARNAYVLSIMPKELTVESTLPAYEGYRVTAAPFVTGTQLWGTADVTRTRSVRVNGRLVEWAPEQGEWSIGTDPVSLSPGINRVLVEAYEGLDGAGKAIDSAAIDVWCDCGRGGLLEGTLSSDTAVDAGFSPWWVRTTVVVGPNVTLTIGPGSTVFFEPGTGIVVRPGGRLVAEGLPHQRIRLGQQPGTTSSWEGIRFDHTLQDNRLAFLDMEYAGGQGASLDVQHSRVRMDHVSWGRTTAPILHLVHPMVTVRDCAFPSLDSADVVSGMGLEGEEQLMFERCTFNAATGSNGIVYFAQGQRPGPILQMYDCLFEGGGGDGVVLEDADAHLEGCVFTNFRRANGLGGGSLAISTLAGGNDLVELYVARSLFVGNDGAVSLDGGGFMYAENNTFVDTGHPVVRFAAQGGHGGRAYVAGSIFWNSAVLFDPPSPDLAMLQVHHSILPTPWHHLGQGNLDVDPLFVGPDDFHLKPTSPAREAGLWELDMGAYVPAGATVSGEPSAVTHLTASVLTVGGPGITHYRYSVNGPNGPWSAERPVDMPIELTGLQHGHTYTVYVLGKGFGGVWQEQPAVSRTWAVDVAHGHLEISEILAVNDTVYEHDGTFPDLVELHYDGPAAMDLSGWMLSDDAEEPAKFVFPAGVTMSPGDRLVLFADTAPSTSGLHLGFALGAQGDELYLCDRDGALIDSVVFGRQLPDLSIGRLGHDRQWHLARPSFGLANVGEHLGEPDGMKINEWLAGQEVCFDRDFIELYNLHALAVDVGGFYLTDDLLSRKGKYRIRPLSFVPGHGFGVFQADEEGVPDRTGVKLSLDGDVIGLFDPDLRAVDAVIYGPQTPDVSEGRSPDGSASWAYFVLPTPGLANPDTPETIISNVALVPEDAPKRVIVPTSADHVPDEWKSDIGFDDSDWLTVSGRPGGIGFDRGSGYQSLISLDLGAQMQGRYVGCYVRVPFQLDTGQLNALNELHLGARYDNGFVAYLNGVEIGRVAVTGPVAWDSVAQSGHEARAGEFDVILDVSGHINLLRAGDNLLAIHAMNSSTTSGDFLISTALNGATITVTGDEEYPYAQQLSLLGGLRITELMYHAAEGDDLDYVELQNVGDEALDLTGVRLVGGIEFTFSSMRLAPLEYVVVVDDRVAFESVHGAAINVAGEYTGRLSDRGETIVLKLAEPFEAAILRFGYSDEWYPATDGGGTSLTIKDLTAAPVTWDDPENWQSSDPSPAGP